MNLKSARGFSLIELMVGIIIVGLLSAVSLGSITAIQKNNNDAKRQSDLKLLQSALQQFYADQNRYPLAFTITAGTALTNCTGSSGCTVNKTYLSSMPGDPTTGTTTPYCYVPLAAQGGSTACSSSTPANCHYYELWTNLENTPGATSSCNGIANYDFKVTPL